MISAYVDSGNIDALEAMLDIRQVPNHSKELNSVISMVTLIRKGITDAGTKRQQLSNQTIKDINADMYRQLAELGEGATIEERGRESLNPLPDNLNSKESSRKQGLYVTNTMS